MRGLAVPDDVHKDPEIVPIEVEIVSIEVEIVPIEVEIVPIEVASRFDLNLHSFQKTLEDVSTAIKAWLDNPPGKDVDPELLAKRTTSLATEIVQAYAHTIDPGGEALKAEEEKLQREEERRQRAKEQRKRRREQRHDVTLEELLAEEGLLGDEQPAEDEESPRE